MVFTNAQVLELPVAAARQLASQLNRQEARQRQQEQHRLQRTKNDDKVAPGQANKNDKMSKSTAVLSAAAAAATNASAGAASATAGAADATPAAAGVSTTVESAPTATADEPSMEIIDAKNTEAAAAASMDTSGDTSGTEALGKETGAAAAGPASSPTVQGFDAADGDINEVGGADDAVMQEVESALLPSLSVVSAVPRAVGCGGGSDSRAGSSCSTTTGNKRRATTNVSTSNTGNTASSSTPPKVKVKKEVRQRSVVAEGVATVCVLKISAADEPHRPYFGFSAAQAFHAMFKRVCEARREALLQLVQVHTAQHSAPAPAAAAPKDKAPIAETSQAAVPAGAASEGANDDAAPDAGSGTGKVSKLDPRKTSSRTTASSLTAQKDARAWLEPRVFGRRSAFASFGLTPAQWFGFGVALVQRRLEALPCVADLAVLPKLPPPSFIANARAAAAAAAAATTTPTAAAAATPSGAVPLSPAEVVATAEAAAATAAAAAWPPRYRCRFVKPTSDAVLSAVRALAARDARVKPNPSGCARAESRSNVASATARSKRVTRELHSGGGDGGSSSSGSGASGAAARGARKGARAKTAGSGGGDGEDTNRGSRSGLHVRNDSSSDEVCVCVVVFSVGTKRAIIGNTKQCLNFFFVLHAYTLQRCLRCYNCFPVYFLIALFP